MKALKLELSSDSGMLFDAGGIEIHFAEYNPSSFGNVSLIVPFSTGFGFRGDVSFYTGDDLRIHIECSVYSDCCDAPLRFSSDVARTVPPRFTESFIPPEDAVIVCEKCERECAYSNAFKHSVYFNSRGALHCKPSFIAPSGIEEWFDFVYSVTPGNSVLGAPLVSTFFTSPIWAVQGAISRFWHDYFGSAETELWEASAEYRRSKQENLLSGATTLETWANIDEEMEDLAESIVKSLTPDLEEKFADLVLKAVWQDRELA